MLVLFSSLKILLADLSLIDDLHAQYIWLLFAKSFGRSESISVSFLQVNVLYFVNDPLTIWS